ncbi:hypothetical protein MANES_01G113301v8 [Manihot esculenta]|uniref:Uncharacterized protein n=1 Tax=Manihot esculenta TaxID=3983 RepID=A0ACB7IC81_MANES|nr:hypothetical protein MANES_01G113301v8 [Manihot esculenta]
MEKLWGKARTRFPPINTDVGEFNFFTNKPSKLSYTTISPHSSLITIAFCSILKAGLLCCIPRAWRLLSGVLSKGKYLKMDHQSS